MGGLSFQIKRSFFAFFFFLQFLLFISFFYVFFSFTTFFWIFVTFDNLTFVFLYFWVSFFLLFWLFKYVTRSIILIKLCTGSYNNSFELCFNLWLHITTSLGLICHSQGSQRAFRLRHKWTVFKDQPELQDLLRGPTS